jgi:Ulp1 family protease catalytic subunit
VVFAPEGKQKTKTKNKYILSRRAYTQLLAMAGIPAAISNILLPSPRLSIIDFIQFPTPPKNLSRLGHLSATPTLFSDAPSAITDERNAVALRRIPRPSLDDIIECRKKLLEAGSTKKYQSIDYPISTTQTLKVPIWAFDYWEALERICEEKDLWLAVEKKLKKEGAHEITDLLSTVPWNYSLPRSLGFHVVELAKFCTDDWMGDVQMDQMVFVINNQLQSTNQIVLDWPHTFLMIRTYRYNRDTYFDKPTVLHTNGAKIEGKNPTHTKIGIYFSVNCSGDLPVPNTMGNHWVGVVVDVVEKKILYVDPKKYPPPSELMLVLRWWLGQHVEGDFVVDTEVLACTWQNDDFSCGVWTLNAIAHHLCPRKFRLIQNSQDAIKERRTQIKQIVTLMRTEVS